MTATYRFRLLVSVGTVLVGAGALTLAEQGAVLPFATMSERTITLHPSGATLKIPEAVQTAERPASYGRKLVFTAYLSRPDLERLRVPQPDRTWDEWDGPYSAILNAVLPFDACAVHFGTEPFGPGGGSFGDLQTRVYVVDAPATTIASRIATEGLSQAKAKQRSPEAAVTPAAAVGPWTVTTIALTLGGSDYRASARVDFYTREFGRQTVVLVFMYSPNARWPWKAAIDEIVASFARPQSATQGQLRLTYLGAAGWEITNGIVVLLVDPYLTRAKYGTPIDGVSPDDPRPTVTNSTIVPSDTATIDQHITRANVIVVTHSHPDHSLDVPYIATKTGAMVVGTESTANLARASGVPESQLKVVSGKEELTFPGVTIHVIPSLHGIFSPPRPGAPPPVPPTIPRDIKPPFRYGTHQEGGTLAYLIGMGGHELIVFGSMNFIESEITGLRPDIALIGGMPERAFIENYTGRIMRALGNPRTVIPNHWDQFNVPYSFSQQHAVDRVQSFVQEVKAASPNTRVIVPAHFKPIVIER